MGVVLHFYQYRNDNNSSLTMKVMGLIALTVAMCLLSTTIAQPVFLLDPITAASFSTAAGLTLTGASAATLTVPTSTLILAKLAAAKKLALLKILADQQQ